jgi:hypothetical protein
VETGLESGSARMLHIGPMRKFVTFCFATAALTAVPTMWAGPCTPAMASDHPAVAPAASTASVTAAAPAFDSLSAPWGIGDFSGDALYADVDEVSPSEPHPMIPLPPAVWAGFAGLAYVARRVVRRHPSARP